MTEFRLELRGVERRFRQGRVEVRVLSGVDFGLRAGEMTALVGASGSGKSTLLHIAGLLDRCDGGRIFLDGRDVTRLSERDRTLARRGRIGFVYQYHHLLADFSALENLVIPQRLNGVARREARRVARELLSVVGLGKRAGHRPGALSGGEQQRVALCRAIVSRPGLVLADEPTGNLDSAAAGEVFSLLRTLVRSSGASALVATHNLEMARRMDRVLVLKKGCVVERN
ncbi:MAG: ABC transporter ATP-binding protein [Alphaproteobacteria bacterium]|nr:ABC transporter ATP-binding protein [Alphaproteobacteria bacterium]MDA8003471.1 ABC transporter ATP-binding protein [Alphaproteobacteria bacterium]MDA8005141.1 ABC transporter ATP-binding protein [Alphaproteobacteria bacterium]MDA8013132.1 ABC transporter ATP-binding protein [Alphaproteobacteria bacterium]